MISRRVNWVSEKDEMMLEVIVLCPGLVGVLCWVHWVVEKEQTMWAQWLALLNLAIEKE